MRRFTILGLMGLVLALAVGLAALRGANDYWAGGLQLAALFLLGTAVLGAIYERGPRRAGWLGFLVFGGAYLAVATAPWPSEGVGSGLLTTRAMSYASARVDSASHLRDKLRFRGKVGGLTVFDEAGIGADPSQRWKAILPGAGNRDAFLSIGHCLFALLAGLLGAAIARRFETRRHLAEDRS